ncbi:unnamed protein product [Timema podura]|uniref:Uncharacterized protein n=1 Tax=Timema podura TaxID=61482 RepID=A0ABN7NZV8_TIMPD|nr:unnamed protein product [Timema podura]
MTISQYSKDPTLRNLSAKMYDDLRENSHSFREAAARTCGTNFAFVVNEDHLMSLLDQMPCNVISLPSFSFKTSLVFTLAKKNPYRRFINRSLRQLTTSGILKKLLRDSRATELSGPDNIITTVQLSSVAFLYSFLCAGMTTFPWQKDLISSSLMVAPSLGRTQRQISSPQRASGTPKA